MKKCFLMAAAAAMLSMTAVSCQSGSKDNEADDEEVTEVSKDDAANAGPQVAEARVFKVGDLSKAKVDTEGYKTTESGLMYKVVKEGTGKQPASADAVVKVHYAGKLLDGTVFDSSYDRGEPITFPLKAVIPGWTEGVQLMKEGAKYQFIIPSGLAYGQQGTPGGPVGPNADLYFEVELLEVM